MLGFKRYDATHAAWGGLTTTCTLFRDELEMDPRGRDLQLQVDALNGDTWTVDVMIEGSQIFRVYNDNGGAGFTADGMVLIDDIQVTGVRVNLSGGAATAPAVIVNHRRRGI